MTASFHEVRFPTSISRGATGGPQRRTEIVVLGSGFEERNSRWANSRRRYDAGLGLRTLDQIHDVIRFFEERRGRLYGFRWKDHADFKSSPPLGPVSQQDQLLGIGDGITASFQLFKRYGEGATAYDRKIAKPIAGTVKVAIDTVAQTPGTDFDVDTATGIVTFLSQPPGNGVQITAGFEFDVPVRFGADQLEINLAAFDAGQIPDIPIVEIAL